MFSGNCYVKVTLHDYIGSPRSQFFICMLCLPGHCHCRHNVNSVISQFVSSRKLSLLSQSQWCYHPICVFQDSVIAITKLMVLSANLCLPGHCHCHHKVNGLISQLVPSRTLSLPSQSRWCYQPICVFQDIVIVITKSMVLSANLCRSSVESFLRGNS